MRRSIVLAAMLIGCGGGNDQDARTTACERMRDHLVDLRLDGSRNLPAADLEQHRAALVASLGPQFVSTCVDRTSDDELDCLTKAADSTAAGACVKSGRAN